LYRLDETKLKNILVVEVFSLLLYSQ